MFTTVLTGMLLCAATVQQTDTTVSVEPGSRLEIASFRGEVVIRTWPRNEVRVVADHPTRTAVRIDAWGSTVRLEAESYRGPSIIIAYSHCIGQGFNLRVGLEHQKAAVASGAWMLYRYDPRLIDQSKNPLQLDSKEPSMTLQDFAKQEIRFTSLFKTNPNEADRLLELYQEDINVRWSQYAYMAAAAPTGGDGKG